MRGLARRVLREEFGRFYLLPEGGSNELALRGCSEIPGEIDIDFDVDWYTFQLNAGDDYHVTLSQLAADFTFRLYHLSAAGNLSYIGSPVDNGDLAGIGQIDVGPLRCLIDLEGFRSGSLNVLVDLENKRLYANP